MRLARLGGAGGSAAAGSEAAATSPTVAATEPAAAATTPAETTAPSTAITIDMVDLAFEPKDVTIPADTDVTITLVNKGAAQHQFKVTDHDIDSGPVDPGKSAEVKVNLPAGDYKFHCPVPGHTEAGMVGVLHVVAGGGEAAVSSPEVPATPAATTEAAAAATTPAATTELATAFTIDMVDIAFQPNELTIPADTDVTITLDNKGAAQHQFKVYDQNIDSGPVDPGKSAEVKVNLPPGDYKFHCPIPGHTEAGMVGVLHVK